MKRNFRFRFFSWLLLILFSYNIAGCYATFFAWKIWMHEQLETLASALPNNQLTVIKLSSTEKIDNEINADGKMYDVLRTKKINGITYCYCIRDFEEETLAAGLSDNDALSKVHNDLGKAIKSLQKNTVEKYTSSANQYHDPFVSITANQYLPGVKDADDFSIVKDSPPPKS